MILDPTEVNLRAAGEAIRRGELVIAPTETVYGLAADALDPAAVARVFAAKGRPADHPLIVHIAHLETLDLVTPRVPKDARRLIERFWPGPLTLVLPRGEAVPRETTGGGDTVAVRVPAHPVMLRLLDAAGTPLAAPSANPFTALSPTRVEDLDPGLLARVWGALDGGPCAYGIESTVVDVTEDEPRLLRPGAVPRAAIEAVLRRSLRGATEARRSPGTHPRHYAPRVPLRLADRLGPDDAGLTFDPPANPLQREMPRVPAAYAIALYAALHRLEESGAAEIVVARPPDDEAWEAVNDRLRRAAHVEAK